MKVSLPTNDLTFWLVDIQGAKGTLYEGEHFTLQLKFTNDYVYSFNNQAYRSSRSHIR